jgi:integrase/recombinase XerD
MKPLRQTRLPIALSHKDCMQIINAVGHPVYRNCILLMYSCGLRISEAIKIQVSHIDKPTSILTIIGKYNRQRQVPVPPTTLHVPQLDSRILLPMYFGIVSLHDY